MRLLLEANEHITTETVQEDILETAREMESLRAMLPGTDVLNDRVLRLRVEVGIQKREKFVAELKELLLAREEMR